jgi:hypothetical protein
MGGTQLVIVDNPILSKPPELFVAAAVRIIFIDVLDSKQQLHSRH